MEQNLWIWGFSSPVIVLRMAFDIIIDMIICHTAIENLSDPIGCLLDFTNPYYTALAGNMKARAKKDNSIWNHT